MGILLNNRRHIATSHFRFNTAELHNFFLDFNQLDGKLHFLYHLQYCNYFLLSYKG